MSYEDGSQDTSSASDGGLSRTEGGAHISTKGAPTMNSSGISKRNESGFSNEEASPGPIPPLESRTYDLGNLPLHNEDAGLCSNRTPHKRTFDLYTTSRSRRTSDQVS